MVSCDAVMLIAFGGPESMDEVRPFLRRVLAGRPVPEARFDEVARHYEVIGGRSPLGEITRRQAAALEAALANAGIALPLTIGMRNSAPFIRDTLEVLHARGAKRVLGLIMAAHESPASHGRYQEAVTQACAELGTPAPEISYTKSFHAHPGFIAANIEHARIALSRLPEDERTHAKLIMTAHSIPRAIAERSPYRAQLGETAALVANGLGHETFRIAYQSRSGSPHDPWLEPDINDVIREEAKAGTRALLLCPIGFVCDHVEVLYDLDVEAAATAHAEGIAIARAQAANDHPAFIGALADCVRHALA
jgi:ferrochelatase